MMAAPGRTIDAKLFVGTDDWVIDLSDSVATLSVNGDASITQQAVLGERHETAIANTSTHMIDVGTAYITDETEDLRSRNGANSGTPWVLVFDTELDMGYAMEALLTGVPESAPTNDAITTSFSFPQADRFFADPDNGGTNDFTFTASDDTETVGAIADDAGLFVVVTEYGHSSALTVTLASRTASVDSEGIYYLGKAAAAHANANVSIASGLSGANEVTGYVFTAQEVDA